MYRVVYSASCIMELRFLSHKEYRKPLHASPFSLASLPTPSMELHDPSIIAGTSSTSSHFTSDIKDSEIVHNHMNVDPEIIRPQPRRPWYRRIHRRLASSFPRANGFRLYLRGPRPKVDLPGTSCNVLHHVQPKSD